MWSWIILTDKGLRNIRLVDLKFHTQVKGWVCDASSHVYNFNTSGPFRSGSQITGFISNTICNSLSRFGFDNDYNTHDGRPVIFNNKADICPKENCYCGMDIGIPKGIDLDHLTKFKTTFKSLSDEEKNKIPYYDNEKILAFGLSGFIDDALIHIDWFLGRRCNFDCHYCPPTIHDNFSPIHNMKKLENDYKFLTDIIIERELNLDNKLASYIFGGGEPTLIPHYYDFIKMIHDDDRFNTKILTLTNLTGTVKKLYKLNTLSDITFSVHLAYMTDKFINKVQQFLELRDENCKHLNVKFMYDKDYKDRILKIIDLASQYKNLHYEVMALHNKTDANELEASKKKLYKYTDEDREFFKLRGHL